MSAFEEFRVARLTFPLSNYFYNRKKILRNFRNAISVESFSTDAIEKLQLYKLKQTLGFAYQFVPFYRKRFDAIGFLPSDFKDLNDLKKIPSLSREDVIDFHKEMVDERLQGAIPLADRRKGDPGSPIPFANFKRYKLLRNTSSGSTGAPTIFYEDGARTAMNWAYEMRLKSWFGVNPGAREARLVKLSTDYNPSNRTILMRKMLWNQLILPGTNLSDEDFQFCYQGILKFKPKVIFGYPSALAGLSAYIQKRQLSTSSCRPQLAVGWAGPIYEHEERIIKEAFGCAVTNNYGSREVGHVAGRCTEGSMHINDENLIVESEPFNILGRNERLGEILVTTLDPTPMPFIRYRMGDLGQIEASHCNCGRNLRVINNLIGRTGEIFLTKDGKMISPNFWCRFFFVNQFSNAIRRFQVIYKKNKDLKIIIERDDGYDEQVENYVKDGIRKNFSPETGLEIEYVPKIVPKISGKYQMVVNEATA